MMTTMTACSTAILAEKSILYTYSIEIFTNALARRFYEQMVAFIKSRTWTFKQTFETSHFNESRLSICRLRSELKYSEKQAPEKGTFYG